jgi:hypothetical protein
MLVWIKTPGQIKNVWSRIKKRRDVQDKKRRGAQFGRLYYIFYYLIPISWIGSYDNDLDHPHIEH